MCDKNKQDQTIEKPSKEAILKTIYLYMACHGELYSNLMSLADKIYDNWDNFDEMVHTEKISDDCPFVGITFTNPDDNR